MLRDRQIQPKDKYQVWWFPTVWPEEVKAHWQLAGSFEYPEQAFLKKAELHQQDQQAEILCTQTVNFEVRLRNE